MALKKRNKISAEFSMSSLTDIIFLLLIFFMLTSSIVVPNALNLKLPGQSSSNTTVSKLPDNIYINNSGAYSFNGRATSLVGLKAKLKTLRANNKKAAVMITPERKASTQSVVSVLDLARKMKVNAIMNEPK